VTAKAKLAQSGYDGSPIPFTYPTSVLVNADEMAKAVANYLSAVGITVQPIPIDYSTFLQQWAGKQITGMYMMQYKNGTDADTIVSSLYARGTRVLFDDPEVFATVDKSRETTGDERLAVLADLEKQVLDQHRYYAPLVVPNAVYGMTEGVPMTPNPFNPVLVAWK
jgi:peptide/nickel transport system substrate-binding protein